MYSIALVAGVACQVSSASWAVAFASVAELTDHHDAGALVVPVPPSRVTGST